MDKAEPSLMPEWLWNSGSSGSGGSRSRLILSRLPSDDHHGSKNSRRKFSGSNNERNGEHLAVPGRSSHSNFHRSSSAKDSRHSRSHGSSSRNSRAREWDDRHDFRDRDKTMMGKNRYFEYDDDLPLQSSKDVRHPFKSMSFRKSEATLPRKVSGDLNGGCNSHQINSSALSLPGGTMTSTTLGKDFPSLKPEKELVSLELRRTPSPGLAASPTSVQSSTSDMIAPEKWSSSLAEAPASNGNNSTGNLSSPLSVSAGSAPLAHRLNGLNMAEAVAQSPIRASTPPQLSVDTQRREELAIKQSKQLIPVTPTMPKPSTLSSFDKSKSRAIQQSPFSRFDAPKSDTSKLQVLKSSREPNGIVSSILKEKGSPNNGLTSPLSQKLMGPSATPNRKSIPVNGHTVAAPDRRTVAPPMGILEKRPTQIQSRKDFLNLIKRQSSGASITAGTACSTSTVEKRETPLEAGVAPEDASAAVWENKQDLRGHILPVDMENGSKVTENGDGLESGGKVAENVECIENGGNQPTENGECWIGPDSLEYVPPHDEEEAAFLRSMGWDDFSEEEPLTEEEIRSFCERHKINPPPEILRQWSSEREV